VLSAFFLDNPITSTISVLTSSYPYKQKKSKMNNTWERNFLRKEDGGGILFSSPLSLPSLGDVLDEVFKSKGQDIV